MTFDLDRMPQQRSQGLFPPVDTYLRSTCSPPQCGASLVVTGTASNMLLTATHPLPTRAGRLLAVGEASGFPERRFVVFQSCSR